MFRRRMTYPLFITLLMGGLVALLFRAWLLWLLPFDGLYGQDAYFYLSATQELARIWTDSSQLWQWLTVWGTPPVSSWPLGYHLQMAFVSLITGPTAASGQLVSFSTGTLTPVLTTLLFVELWRWNKGSGIRDRGSELPTDPRSLIPDPLPSSVLLGAALAGLIVCVSTLSVRASLVVMSDMAALFWAVLGVWLALRYLRTSQPNQNPKSKIQDPKSVTLGVVAGLCLGMASITRYVYLLMIVPVFGFWILDFGFWIDRKKSKIQNPKSKIPHSEIKRFVPLAIGLFFLVGLQFLHNWAHPRTSLSTVISTWNPAHAWQTTFDSPDGHLSHEQPMADFFLLRPLLSPEYVGLALLPLFVLGIVGLVRRRAVVPAILLVGWWLLFAGFFSGTIYQNGRYILSYLPPMAILAGLGLIWILDFGFWTLSSQPKTQNPKSKIVLGFALVVCLAGAGLFAEASAAANDYRALIAQKEDYLQAARCLRSAAGDALPQRPVFSFNVTFTLRQYTRISPRELYFETPASVDAALKGEVPPVRGYLLLPLNGFEAQWGNTNMGETYRHLKRNYNLTKVGCPSTSFALFEIRR